MDRCRPLRHGRLRVDAVVHRIGGIFKGVNLDACPVDAQQAVLAFGHDTEILRKRIVKRHAGLDHNGAVG